MLLQERQVEMRELAAQLTERLVGPSDRKSARARIRQLIKFEEQSAENTRETMARSDKPHVQKSGAGALRNRQDTIENLQDAYAALRDRKDAELAVEFLLKAADCGGKKSVKAARSNPTIALYVEYLAETDPTFKEWLKGKGMAV